MIAAFFLNRGIVWSQREPIPDYLREELTRYQEHLGPDILRIVAKPDRVESYRLDPDSTNQTKEKLCGYVISERGPLLNASQIDMFGSCFLDSQSTLNRRVVKNRPPSMITKMCMFHPGVGLRFIKMNEHVDVLLCFGCSQWDIYFNDRSVSDYFDPIREVLVDQVVPLFPNDPAIAALKNDRDH